MAESLSDLKEILSSVESLLDEVGFPSTYHQSKDVLQNVAQHWVGRTLIGCNDDLAGFIDLVLKREFGIDSNLIRSLEMQDWGPNKDSPHVKVTTDNLNLDYSKKVEEHFDLEFWYRLGSNKVRISDNTDRLGRKDIIFPNATQYTADVEFLKRSEKQETFEIIVLKKNSGKLKHAKNMILMNKNVKTSYFGKLEILLADAFTFNKSTLTLPIERDGFNVGSIDLTFHFINQNNLPVFEVLSATIMDIVMLGLYELWKFGNNERNSSEKNDLCQPATKTSTSTSTYNNSSCVKYLGELKYYVKVTSYPSPDLRFQCNAGVEKETSSVTDMTHKDTYKGNVMTKEMVEGLVVSLNNLYIVENLPNNEQCEVFIPIESFMHDHISLSVSTNQSKQVPIEHISITSIPWKLGRTIINKQLNCRLEIISNYRSICGNKKELINVVKCMALLTQYNHNFLNLKKRTIPWDGTLANKLENIASILALILDKDEWEEIEAWAVITVSIIFECVDDQLLHQALLIMRKRSESELSTPNPILTREEQISTIQNFVLYGTKAIAIIDLSCTKVKENLLFSKLESIIGGLVLLHKNKNQELLSILSRQIFLFISTNAYQSSMNLKGIVDYLVGCEMNINMANKDFGFFGINIWSPALASAYLKVLFPLIEKTVITSNMTSSACSFDTSGCLEECKAIYSIFLKSKSLLQRCDKTEHDEWSHKIFMLFEPYLSVWVAVAYETAETQIKRVLDLEKEKFRQKRAKSGASKDISIHGVKMHKSSKPLDEFDDELEGAIDVRRIFQTCISTWENLNWYERETEIQFGTSLFLKLQYLIDYYINGLKEMFLEDTFLDLEELILLLKSLFHLQQEYIGEFWRKLDEKINENHEDKKMATEDSISILKVVKRNIDYMINKLTGRFALDQKEHLRRLLPQPETYLTTSKTLLMTTKLSSKLIRTKNDAIIEVASYSVNETIDEYLSNMILRFEEQINKHSEDLDIVSSVTLKTQLCFKKQLFQVHSDNLEEFYHTIVYKEFEKTKNVDVFACMKTLLAKDKELRRQHFVEESASLIKIGKEMNLKCFSPMNLISEYMQYINDRLDLHDNDVGTLTFSKGLIDDPGVSRLIILLKSISNLRPRNGKETCNFSIDVSLQPCNIGQVWKQNTPVYSKKTLYLFDVEEDSYHSKSNENVGYKITFPLTKLDMDDPTKHKKFLEFRLYDQSDTKIRKYLLGHFILPIEKVPKFSSTEEFLKQESTTGGISVFKNYSINDILMEENNNQYGRLIACWDELKCRQDKVSRQFVQSQHYKMEKYDENLTNSK